MLKILARPDLGWLKGLNSRNEASFFHQGELVWRAGVRCIVPSYILDYQIVLSTRIDLQKKTVFAIDTFYPADIMLFRSPLPSQNLWQSHFISVAYVRCVWVMGCVSYGMPGKKYGCCQSPCPDEYCAKNPHKPCARLVASFAGNKPAIFEILLFFVLSLK